MADTPADPGGVPSSGARGAGHQPAPLLTATGITKTFPGLRALDGVSVEVHSGEIVALLGQNGSGKSTLVKVLAGVYECDPGGSVEVRNSLGELLGVSESRAALHFIHQDLGLVPTLSTVENLDISRPLRRHDMAPARNRSEREHAEALLARFDLDIDVTVPVALLSPAERAIVAIARALDGWERPDQLLILDEPTAALHASESQVLLRAVRQVAREGAGVIYISHRLDEVMSLADRIVVLRNGELVADQETDDLDMDRLVQLIAGRAVEATRTTRERRQREVVLSAQDLAGATVEDVSLEVHAGEILGVCGALGSGRERLGGLLFGDVRRRAGTVHVKGAELRAGSTRAAVRAGLAFVPADRLARAIVGDMTLVENLTLPRLGEHTRFSWLDTGAETAEAQEWIERVEVSPAHPRQRIRLFSGGNQQKVVLAKWLRNDPDVLILDDPTQGVDVGAKETIYGLIRRAADNGMSVLVSSSDDKELADICDRVLVMRDGRVHAEIPHAELSEERLLRESFGWARDSEVM